MSHCESHSLILLQVQQEEASRHLQSTLQPVGVTVLQTDRKQRYRTWRTRCDRQQHLKAAMITNSIHQMFINNSQVENSGNRPSVAFPPDTPHSFSLKPTVYGDSAASF